MSQGAGGIGSAGRVSEIGGQRGLHHLAGDSTPGPLRVGPDRPERVQGMPALVHHGVDQLRELLGVWFRLTTIMGWISSCQCRHWNWPVFSLRPTRG